MEVRRTDGTLLRACDFSSEDSEHGYGVDYAQWTTDSHFFVFTMRNSGGHSPMYVPVAFWSRNGYSFYRLSDHYTANETFAVCAADEVQVTTWPAMHPATVSLRDPKPGEVTSLR